MPVNIILSRSQTKAQSYPEKYRFLATTSTFDFIGKDDKKSEFPLSFRLVRFKTNCGTATVVTNLPEAEFPIDKIKLIYKKRWGIETSFRLLKYSVCLNCFHSKKADFIIQEIFARLIMFNFSLFISLCIEVMHKNTKYTYEINITELIYICRRYIRNEISPQNVDALVRRNTVPIRPSMNSERKIKAKTSTSFMYRIS